VTQQTSLPFGRTDITVEELKQLVDTEEAATQAEKGGVNDAKNQIEDFITCIPDLLNWLEEDQVQERSIQALRRRSAHA